MIIFVYHSKLPELQKTRQIVSGGFCYDLASFRKFRKERRAKINNKITKIRENWKSEKRREFQDDRRLVLDTSIEERSKLKIDETEVAIEPEIGAG